MRELFLVSQRRLWTDFEPFYENEDLFLERKRLFLGRVSRKKSVSRALFVFVRTDTGDWTPDTGQNSEFFFRVTKDQTPAAPRRLRRRFAANIKPQQG